MCESTYIGQYRTVGGNGVNIWVSRFEVFGDIMGRAGGFSYLSSEATDWRDTYASFIATNTARYRQVTWKKSGAMENCVGFIDGTVIENEITGNSEKQNMKYNGHKRCNSIKFQAVTTLDGLILHAHRPMEGIRHEWMLYTEDT